MDAETLIFKMFKHYNVNTLNQLAQIIDTPAATISKWKQRNSISAIKKKCIKLGIYQNIFGDTTFTQTGDHSQQIQNQNNNDAGMLINSTPNKSNNNSNNTSKIDPELLPLFEALNSVAVAFNKKEILKKEIGKLISKMSTL